MPQRTCDECGHEVSSPQPTARYCSTPCRKIANRRLAGESYHRRKDEIAARRRITRPPRACGVCSSEFVPRRVDSRFCSAKCAKWFDNHVGKGICSTDGCDKPLRAKGYCAYHYKRFVNPPSKVDVACPTCGTVTQKRNSGSSTRLYCSLKCRPLRFGVTRKSKALVHVGPSDAVTWLPPQHPVIAGVAKQHARTWYCGDCVWCGASFVHSQPMSKFCSGQCQRKQMRARRRAREAGASGCYTWTEVARKWIDNGKVCHYCRQHFDLSHIEPDHVVPLSRGGSDSIVNVVPSCHGCNCDKRDLMLDEWPEDRARRVLPPLAGLAARLIAA